MRRFACFVMVMVSMAMSTAAFATVLPGGDIPWGWQLCEPVSGELQLDHVLQMTLALRRRNMDKLEKIFWEVSDPQNENYGNHLNHEEMRELISPGPVALVTVTDWLHSNGVNDYTVSHHEDSIAFDATEAQVEKLLNVTFAMYEHQVTHQRTARAVGAMEVPSAIAELVEVFAGHHGFPLAKTISKKQREIHRSAEGSTTNVTPALLYKVYNQSYFPRTPSGQKNIQSFFQAQGQYVNLTELQIFCDALAPELDNCTIDRFIGANTAQNDGESNLDSQYIMATGHGTETWVYSYPSDKLCDALIRWGHDVLSEKNGTFPWVISMSYGSQSVPNYCFSELDRVARDIQKMGAMGITVVIASGDYGSGEFPWGLSVFGASEYNNGLLGPSMPAVIPYATAVGGTSFIAGDGGQEMAANFSGGGFSWDYPQPAYQKEAVSDFFAKKGKLPPFLSYNASGRGTPDLSLLGVNCAVVVADHFGADTGTSCSAPIFAGMVSMLNNIRLETGKTMGFINPFLYQNPQGFNDITVGTNDLNRNGYGWHATEGWDPVTGLGTPNWGMLARAVKALNADTRQRSLGDALFAPPFSPAADLHGNTGSSSAHLETAFTIQMPHSAIPRALLSETDKFMFPFGNTLYVIGNRFGTALNAVNLATKSNQWSATVAGLISAVQPTSTLVLVQSSHQVHGYHPMSGEQLWSTDTFELHNGTVSGPPIVGSLSATNGSNTLISTKDHTKLYSDVLLTVETISGTVLKKENMSSAAVFYNGTAYLSTTGTFEARCIATDAVLWRTGAAKLAILFPSISPLLAVSPKYVLVANATPNSEAAVLDQGTGAVIFTLEGFHGFNQRIPGTKPVFVDDYLVCAFGVENITHVVVDLNTGSIVWKYTSFSSTIIEHPVSWGFLVGVHFVIQSEGVHDENMNSRSLELTIVPLRGNTSFSSSAVSVPFVPRLPRYGYPGTEVGPARPAIIGVNSTRFLVLNSQGYTLFDVAGTLLERQEQLPFPSPFVKCGEFVVYIQRSVVSAMKLAGGN